MTAPLPALMEVLDRADALTRDQLLASAKALGTDHPPAVLEAAVDAYLTHSPGVTPAARSFRFPWRRPTSNQALQTRLRRTRWLAWLCGGDAVVVFEAVFYRSMPLGALFGFLLAISIPNLGVATSLLFILMVGMLAIPAFVLEPLVRSAYFRWRSNWLPDQGVLNYPVEQYAAFATTRVYLQAVLASPVPILLQGDILWLNQTMDAQMRQRAEEATRQAAQADRNQQWAALIQAVSNAS